MAFDRNMISALYRKLLSFYPRAFREQLGESMEQTFHDLCREQKQQPDHGFFLLAIFAETALGIIREHLLILMEGNAVKNILANPASAAITSFVIALPLGLMFLAFMFDIEPLVKPLNELLTIKGQQGEINLLGRIVIYGGLLLLPIAFALNLQPLLKRKGTEGKRRPYTLNVIVGAAILLLIVFTWGGLMLEEIYCLQGLRCD